MTLLTRDELRARREEALRRARLSEQELRDRAADDGLTRDESDALAEVDMVDFLLSD